MFGKRITLFKLFGFEVRLDASWLILGVLIAWTLAVGYFPMRYGGLTGADYWLMGIVCALGLFASIVVHEFAHSLVARRYGLPMKGITLFIFGGVAEMGDEPPDPKTELLMAAAGPLTSIAIGFVLYAIYLPGAGAWPVAVAGIIQYLYWINWLLAGFNLIPAFPLDGGRILRAVIWQRNGDLRRATRIASSIGTGFSIFLIVLAVWQLLVGNFVAAVWWFLIGMFLRAAAQNSYQQVLVREMLQGQPVRRFMNSDPITVPPDISLRDLVEDYVYRYHHKMFPVVTPRHELLGSVTTSRVKAIPRGEWSEHRVAEVLEPYQPSNTISPDTDALGALAKMNNLHFSRLMIVDHQQLVGIIGLKDLLGFLSARLDLDGYAAEGELAEKEPALRR